MLDFEPGDRIMFWRPVGIDLLFFLLGQYISFKKVFGENFH